LLIHELYIHFPTLHIAVAKRGILDNRLEAIANRLE